MTRHVCLRGSAEVPRLVLLDHLSKRAQATNNDIDTGGHQSLMGVWAAIAGEDLLDAVFSQQLRGLDTGPARQGEVGVLHGVEAQVIGLYNQEIGASTKAGINLRL